LKITQTTTKTQPVRSKVQNYYDLVDVFIPALGFYKWGDKAQRYYDAHRKRGALVWQYLNMPMRVSDPYGHYRMQAWRTWIYNMDGGGFWAFADAGVDSWNRYRVGIRRSYSPLFFAGGEIQTSKHWEAFRQGREDIEIFMMLRDRLEQLQTAGLWNTITENAQSLIDTEPQKVEAAAGGKWGVLNWWESGDRTRADVAVNKAMRLLQRLK